MLGKAKDANGDALRRHKKFTEGMLNDELILNELNVEPGQVVVDAGCGTGYMSRLFAKRVGKTGKVYALDISELFVERLSKEAKEMNLFPIVADMSDLTPLPDSCADLVYMSTVLHSLPRSGLMGVVNEVERVLRPGGRFGVVEIDKRETKFGPPMQQRYAPEDLIRAIPFTASRTIPVAEHFYMQMFQVS